MAAFDERSFTSGPKIYKANLAKQASVDDEYTNACQLALQTPPPTPGFIVTNVQLFTLAGPSPTGPVPERLV
jgi:hypothetical protein